MAFFEGYIQRFMAYLADLAGAQGSFEREYTDVHGVCDIAHSEGLFQAVTLEMAVNPARLTRIFLRASNCFATSWRGSFRSGANAGGLAG